MSRIARVALTAMLFISAACTRSFQVYDASKLKDEDKKRDYLFYALPRSVIRVDVPVTKIETSDQAPCLGEKHLYSELFLDKPAKKTTFKLGAPTIAARTEADPSKVYAVDLKFKPFAVTSGVFELSETGALTNATVSHEDKSLDAVLTVAKAALGVVSGVAASESNNDEKKPRTPCESVRDQIDEIRKARVATVTESIRREGATKEFLETVLSKLEEMEAGLLAFFTGETKKTLSSVRCDFRPKDDEPKATRQLFVFTADAGIRDQSSACVVPAAIRPGGAGTKPQAVTLTLDTEDVQYADTVEKAMRDIDGTARGFFYRIPANSVLTVDYAGDVRARELMPIAQLGTVATLPVVGGAFVRKASVAPTLNASGGLTKLTVNGEPSGQDAVAGAAEIYTSRRTAKAAAAAAEAAEAEAAATADAAAKDELTLLEKQRKMIEERLKIAEAEKKLADLLSKDEDKP
jgi:hypothetical protein